MLMRWRQFDRAGKIDLASGGSAEYQFSSPDRAKAEQDCHLLFIFERGEGRLGLGSSQSASACKEAAIAAPRCTIREL